MDEPKTVPVPPAQGPPPTSIPAPATTPATPSDWRKPAGRILGVGVIIGAAVLSLWVWNITEHHPRTDDAVALANVVGIAPRVRGQIVKINVQDNQAVAAKEVLFEIDPADYQLSLAKAKAALATLDQQIVVARAQDAQLKFQIKAADAGVEQAKAELKQAGDTLQRLQPLLTNGFATAQDVERAATAKQVGVAALAAAEQRLSQAQTALSAVGALTAERAGAIAAVDVATLELSYCQVVAPFQGRVISLNISAGAYASAGVPVFSLLDTRKWYVMANFREGQIPHFPPGALVEVYLSAAPNRRFTGKVQGIGWAVQPTGGSDLGAGLPNVPRELNWVHIAQRFPVRIEIENPDLELFRMGASAVAIIK